MSPSKATLSGIAKSNSAKAAVMTPRVIIVYVALFSVGVVVQIGHSAA